MPWGKIASGAQQSCPIADIRVPLNGGGVNRHEDVGFVERRHSFTIRFPSSTVLSRRVRSSPFRQSV